MILYKYVNLDTANLIMEHSMMKFSKPFSFNDPFELTSLFYDGLETRENQAIKYIAASDCYGILSLTRNPLNPLMWAHYGKGKYAEYGGSINLDRGNDSHAGIVFGIDTNLAEYNDHSLNVIPAKYGSVIYTSTQPKHPFAHSDSLRIYQGFISSFEPEILEALQRTFLYKSYHWSYEEEVRIVRNIHRGRYISEFHDIERQAIKEAYIGIRNSSNKSHLIDLKMRIKEAFPACEIFVCRCSESDWQFEKLPIDDVLSKLKSY